MSGIIDNFQRADTTPGAAGTTTGAGNGWIDVQGGVWFISSNSLHGTADTLPGGQYARDFLVRPATENSLDQFISCDILPQPDNQRANYEVLRYQDANHWYSCGFNRGVNASTLFDIAMYNNGALTILVSQSITGIVGHAYRMTFSARGQSPTTLIGTLYDLTAQTTVCTLNYSDSTSFLQVAGQSGLSIYADTSLSQVSTSSYPSPILTGQLLL